MSVMTSTNEKNANAKNVEFFLERNKKISIEWTGYVKYGE